MLHSLAVVSGRIEVVLLLALKFDCLKLEGLIHLEKLPKVAVESLHLDDRFSVLLDEIVVCRL